MRLVPGKLWMQPHYLPSLRCFSDEGHAPDSRALDKQCHWTTPTTLFYKILDNFMNIHCVLIAPPPTPSFRPPEPRSTSLSHIHVLVKFYFYDSRGPVSEPYRRGPGAIHGQPTSRCAPNEKLLPLPQQPSAVNSSSARGDWCLLSSFLLRGEYWPAWARQCNHHVKSRRWPSTASLPSSDSYILSAAFFRDVPWALGDLIEMACLGLSTQSHLLWTP